MIRTGSAPGCTRWHGTSACAGLGPGGEIPRGGGSRRRAAGDSAGRPARPGADGVRRQLPGGPGAPDERGAPRGRVRPGGLPQGDRAVRARWWRRPTAARSAHPGVVAAAAAVAALAVTAGITVAMTAGGSHRPQASGPGLGGGGPASASSTPPGATGRAPSPARTAPASAHPDVAGGAGGRDQRGAIGRAGHARAHRVTVRHVAPRRRRRPAPPPRDTCWWRPARLMLTSKSGTPASGFFVLTAANGPVSHYTVRVAADARPGHGRPGGRISPGQRARRGDRDGDQQGRADHARRRGAWQPHRHGGLQAQASASTHTLAQALAQALAQGLEGEEPVEFGPGG